jgi:hypothetical protein
MADSRREVARTGPWIEVSPNSSTEFPRLSHRLCELRHKVAGLGLADSQLNTDRAIAELLESLNEHVSEKAQLATRHLECSLPATMWYLHPGGEFERAKDPG